MVCQLTRAPQYVHATIIDDAVVKANEVKARMAEHLSPEQSRILSDVLDSIYTDQNPDLGNQTYIEMFGRAKMVEGCTERTIGYYTGVLRQFCAWLDRPIRLATAEDIRGYLAYLKLERGNGDVSLDNNRRVFLSFFGWLEAEDYIAKSPVRKIKAIKKAKTLKKPFTDTEVVKIRQACKTLRESAIVDLLLSSGMRVGELTGLNRDDLDLKNRKAIVYGKGRKERVCYFDAAAEQFIGEYLDERTDDDDALFVQSHKPHGRLSKGGVETIVRNVGKRAGVGNVHPHRFRRTFATKRLSQGMKLEEIQRLLGHENIETTLLYAQLDTSNLENSARRYL